MKKKSYDALVWAVTIASNFADGEQVVLATEALKEIIVDNPLERLSGRELEVFKAIACGTTPRDSAKALGISVKTFSTYRSRVLEKLELNSNAGIAVLAFELGLVNSVKEKFKPEE